tara:strand:- start:1465 stop:2796 length:1332 start_codon:yes stop_codon:yes gene_type:complete
MSNVPSALLWHEGMLLLPQHFQQQSARFEQLVDWRVRSAIPDGWGLLSIEIDSSALVHGLFRLQKIDAILPDGFVIQHPNELNQPLEIDLSQFHDALRSGPGLIFLALPRSFNGVAGTQGELPRFKSYQPPPVVDTHTGDNEVIIDRCAANFTLMAVEEPSDQFVYMPIAEVSCRDETYSLTRYLPPSLRWDRKSKLGYELEDLAKRAREKAIFLQQRAQGLMAEGNDVDANSTRDRLAAIINSLPKLELMLGGSYSHPYSVYTALADLSGSLSALNMSNIPPRIRPYDHVNSLRGFDDVMAFMHGCLDNVQERYRLTIFNEIDEGFALPSLPDTSISTLVIGVRLKPRQNDSDAMAWMESAIIASESKVHQMTEKRVRGAKRLRIERDTAIELLQSTEMMLFSISLSEDNFDYDTELRVVNMLPAMRDSKPLELALYTVNQG